VQGRSAIAVLPFYHAYGMQILMNCTLHRGTTTVTMPRWDLEQFLSLIQQHRITSLVLVPPIVLALAKHPLVAKYDLSSVETIGSGAAPLGADLQRAASERVAPVRQGYGMTETTVAVSGWPQDGAGMVDGAVGYLLPNVQARIVDVTSGADLGHDERGELWVRGPNIMRGYLNAREATDAMLDSEGWLHTGDVALFDSAGRLFIVDRLKELIKVKGYQVAPAHLEAILLAHPAVADAAVIGIADEEAGERPKAFVVKRAEVDAQTLIDHVAAQVARYERLHAVEFIDAIPKSPSGKILRRVLRESAAPGDSRRT
jgi:acyl-CoA synthetase (AMP-forming)/AMP-acid ligase II